MTMQWQWELIGQECIGCGVCADICPHAAIAMTRDMPYPTAVPQKCVGCMECVEQCPVDAIAVRETAAERTHVQ